MTGLTIHEQAELWRVGPTLSLRQRELIASIIAKRERDASRISWERAQVEWIKSIAAMSGGASHQTYRIPTNPYEGE